MSEFEQLGVQQWLAKQCGYMAMDHPTPIQRACIPAILGGHHVVGGAATGSGKTAAFALPILQELSADVYGVFALVLTPSRELAYQICDQFIALGAPLRVRTMLAIGGVRHEEQVDAIKTRPPIVVATPGRLLHLLRVFPVEAKRAFGHLRFLVLDEADRLTEGDMSRTVRDVLLELPPRPARQVLMFTATLEPRLLSRDVPADISGGLGGGDDGDDEEEEEDGNGEVAEAKDKRSWLELMGVPSSSTSTSTATATEEKKLVVFNLSNRLDDARAERRTRREKSEGGEEEDEVDSGEEAGGASSTTTTALSNIAFPSTLRQSYIFIPDMVKLPNLVAALRAQGKEQSTIVFTNSGVRTELVRLTLQLLGFPVCSLNSLLAQQHRLDNLALFKLGISRILVATDIAARGLDIPTATTVMHYDVPKQAATYVHRVGRTARAGREGLSVAFVTEHDVQLVQRIEKKLSIKLDLWRDKALREENILKVLDEVSAAKVQAKQQVADQFGDRAATLKDQAAVKKRERQSQHEWRQRQQQLQRARGSEGSSSTEAPGSSGSNNGGNGAPATRPVAAEGDVAAKKRARAAEEEAVPARVSWVEPAKAAPADKKAKDRKKPAARGKRV